MDEELYKRVMGGLIQFLFHNVQIIPGFPFKYAFIILDFRIIVRLLL